MSTRMTTTKALIVLITIFAAQTAKTDVNVGPDRPRVRRDYLDDENNFGARLMQMPDFDQKRAADIDVTGLPDDGSQHCGPAAATNILAWLAGNGYPEVALGDIDYAPIAVRDMIHMTGAERAEAKAYNRELYNDVTEVIADLGTAMGTDENGTGSSALVAGLNAYLPQEVSAYRYGRSQCGELDEDISALTLAWPLLTGDAVLVLLGYYSDDDDGASRTGGHWVTLTGVDVEAGEASMRFANPSSADSETSQSAFTNQEAKLTRVRIEHEEGCRRGRLALGTSLAAGRMTLIDTVVVVDVP